MSDPSTTLPRPSRRPTDRGMTLPELLIAVTIVGLIITVLSSALIVTMRTHDSSEGRFNVARAEQNIGMWLPGDLASAAVVTVDPAATPCDRKEVDGAWVVTGEVCPDLGLQAGSNALLIGWSLTDADGHVTWTNVSYYFSPGENGLFELTRIECVSTGGAWDCTTQVVLRDLPAPPPGTDWEPGVTKPSWVIQVSEPLAADGITEDDVVVGDQNLKNAKRVVVTVNGGGSTAGAGGGSNQISITAGGTNRNVIEGTSLQGAPSFNEALSLCGGPMVLLVDESNSIGDVSGALAQVKSGVREFITALIGTPVRLQIVGFHTFSHVLGSSQWHEYFDMTDESDVATLLAAVDTLKDDWSNSPNGGTNWEEAFFRTFYSADGSQVEPPETVVFFTDGVPTFDRLVHRTTPGILPEQPPDPGPAWPDSAGNAYSQVAFNRTDHIATQFRASVRLIGVGIGGVNTGNSTYIINPGAGYHLVWERAYRQYQRYPFQSLRDFETAGYQSRRDFEQVAGYESIRDFEQVTGQQSRRDFEKASRYQSMRDFEVRNNSWSSWRDATPTEYYGWSSSNRRIDGDRSWYDVTRTEFINYRTADGQQSKWQIAAWDNIGPTEYYTNNSPASDHTTETDGYRINGDRSWYNVTSTEWTNYSTQPGAITSGSSANWQRTWSDVTPTQYYTNNSPANDHTSESDGWRINGNRSSWYTVTQAEFNTYSTSPGAVTSGAGTNWQRTWSDVTPTQYYTNNSPANDHTTESDGWRVNGNRGSWYTVTTDEWTNYSTAPGAVIGSTGNWQQVWTDTTPTLYYTNNSPADDHATVTDGWRINGNRGSWYDVTLAEWENYRTAPGATVGVNWRANTSGTPTWITKAEYDSKNTVTGNSDGYHDVGSPQYVSGSNAMDWVVWTASRSGIDSNQFRSSKSYTAPYDSFETADTESVPNWKVLGRLIAGGDNEIEQAAPANGPYENVETANLYLSSNFSQLPVALKAIALGECGGTLTLQTRMNGSPVGDPFMYQNSAQFAADGTQLVIDPTTVTTNRQFTTGNFDFKIDEGLYRDVVILPANLSDIEAYDPAGWSCRAGGSERSFELVDIPPEEAPEGGTPWKGIKVRVAANEAVSCIQSVTR